MKRDQGHKDRRDTYEDFLHDVGRFAGGDEEKDFLDSIGNLPPEEDAGIDLGERVKKVRQTRGLTLEDVSGRADIDVASLSRIEEGSLAPPLGMIIRLAKALDMRMGYFISGDEKKPYTIVRHKDRKVVSRHDSKKGKYYGYEFESLAPYKKDRHMEPFMVTLEPSRTEHERSTHDGQEFIHVLRGRMEVRLGDEIYVLEPGDSIYYDSTVPHLVKCHGEEQTQILAVLYAEK